MIIKTNDKINRINFEYLPRSKYSSVFYGEAFCLESLMNLVYNIRQIIQ